MDLRYLKEDQNAAFDYEFHLPDEMELKLRRIAQLEGDNSFAVLDLGGGNGVFLDKVLNAFPKSHGTLVDISPSLLALNTSYPRKVVKCVNISALDELGGQYDVVFMNWLLHHLVGPTYKVSRSNCVELLRSVKARLREGGVVIVAENCFEAFFGCNVPGWAIFQITRIKNPLWVLVARKFFNTAGTGVGFRSAASFRAVFAEAGYKVVREDEGWTWTQFRTGWKQLAFWLLCIKRVHYRHFYLKAVG